MNLNQELSPNFPAIPCSSAMRIRTIRPTPEFIQFMTEMKAQNELYKRESGESATR